jgi:hypothetical protein
MDNNNFGNQYGGSPNPQNGSFQFSGVNIMEEMRMNQSLGKGIIAGLIASLIGAVLWAGITVLTDHQIGWMAVGVGFLVGYGVRKFGKGIDMSFGIAGAILALFGCLLGNVLAVCIIISHEYAVPFFQVLTRITPGDAVEFLKITFSAVDILFYGLAIYEGFKFSINTVPAQRPGGGTGINSTNS